MSSFIDNAVAHFSGREIRSLEVPEWGTTVYAKNLSMSDKAKMTKRADGDLTSFYCYTIIFGAIDAQGEPLCDIGDKHKLANGVDPDILARVANFIHDGVAPTEEEREKN